MMEQTVLGDPECFLHTRFFSFPPSSCLMEELEKKSSLELELLAFCHRSNNS